MHYFYMIKLTWQRLEIDLVPWVWRPEGKICAIPCCWKLYVITSGIKVIICSVKQVQAQKWQKFHEVSLQQQHERNIVKIWFRNIGVKPKLGPLEIASFLSALHHGHWTFSPETQSGLFWPDPTETRAPHWSDHELNVWFIGFEIFLYY